MTRPPLKSKNIEELESVTIRFAGDSGDGIQLTGGQFTSTTAMAGNDLSTLPDYPAEIRAPAGTLPGVSGFQIQFGSREVLTPGDSPNVLVAMNPAALKANVKDLEPGSIILVNTDAFSVLNLSKAGYKTNPLEDGSISAHRVIQIPLTSLTDQALQGMNMTRTQVDRCKNFFALGIMYWLYERPLEPTLKWIQKKFQKSAQIAEANVKALNAGHAFAETAEIFQHHYRISRAPIAPGRYRNITGNEATALGLIAASKLAAKPLFYGSYPITPASDVLHELSKHKAFGVRTFQAEDEIAAVGAAIGASYAGHLGVTGTSGPGLCLKSEAINLAVMMELPLLILDIQRGGPSTGLPTKTEQADLLQAMYGRNSDSPVAILAPATPGECFTMVIEAMRIAMKYMTPVFFLSDGYLANGSEPWKIPKLKDLPDLRVRHLTDPKDFAPYRRDPKTLSRPWVLPGTPGLEHRIGGIEKQDVTGNVSYDPENHDFMVRIRAQKIAGIDREIPPTRVMGPSKGKVLVVGWGSTYGSITQAVKTLQTEGQSVACVHLRYLNPLPPDLGSILSNYEKILVPEINLGQLLWILRSRFLVDAVGFNQVRGQPLKVREIKNNILKLLAKGKGDPIDNGGR